MFSSQEYNSAVKLFLFALCLEYLALTAKCGLHATELHITKTKTHKRLNRTPLKKDKNKTGSVRSKKINQDGKGPVFSLQIKGAREADIT